MALPPMTLLLVVTCIFALIFFCISFDTLEFQEMGLQYSWVSESLQTEPFDSGRWYLGIGNHFIKFPKMVKSVYLLEDLQAINGGQSWSSRKTNTDFVGPSLSSRTADGLTVRLEVSFQYRLIFDKIYDLYTTLGMNYEHTLVRMAIEQLATSTTKHSAGFFFTNRTAVADEMQKELNDQFEQHAFASVPFFQLRTVHLPNEFEEAIKTTQVRQQEIQIARLEQKKDTVTFQTTVLQAEQKVQVIWNQADAEVQAIVLENDAYCRQFNLTQEIRATALAQIKEASGWNAEQLLAYLRIRAMREHPSEKTTIRL